VIHGKWLRNALILSGVHLFLFTCSRPSVDICHPFNHVTPLPLTQSVGNLFSSFIIVPEMSSFSYATHSVCLSNATWWYFYMAITA